MAVCIAGVGPAAESAQNAPDIATSSTAAMKNIADKAKTALTFLI
jgi:hypothetical protein